MLILLLVLFLLWHFGCYWLFWGLIGMTVILGAYAALDNAKQYEQRYNAWLERNK